MKRPTLFIGASVVLAVAFAGAAQIYRSAQADKAALATSQNREALVRFHSPSLGEAGAPVHIVEFLDPACETCRAFYPLVKDILAANPGKIRLSLRYAPFHQGSEDVVKVLEASRKQGKYWETLEVLLANQSGWTRHHTADVALVWQFLGNLGLDLDKLRTDMASADIARLIRQDLDDARTLNVTKTPDFFVNGRPLPAFGEDYLRRLVSDELAATGPAS
jgi:protein-disulfide isomerase